MLTLSLLSLLSLLLSSSSSLSTPSSGVRSNASLVIDGHQKPRASGARFLSAE